MIEIIKKPILTDEERRIKHRLWNREYYRKLMNDEERRKKNQEYHRNYNREYNRRTQCHKIYYAKHKDQWREYERKNRDKINAVKKEWRNRNKEKVKARAKRNRIKYKDRNKEYYKNYYPTHKETYKFRKLRWLSVARNKERYRERVKQHQIRNKQKALEKIGGARCAYCGVTDIRILEINHVNGINAKEPRKSGRFGYNLYHDIANDKMPTDNLNVLCRTCNTLEYIYRKFPDLKDKCKVHWDTDDVNNSSTEKPMG